jgi:hypothetical protein
MPRAGSRRDKTTLSPRTPGGTMAADVGVAPDGECPMLAFRLYWRVVLSVVGASGIGGRLMLVFRRYAMRSCGCGLGLLVFLIGLSGCGDSDPAVPPVGQLPEETKKAMENLPGAGAKKDMQAQAQKARGKLDLPRKK